jgi:hypothetical protein
MNAAMKVSAFRNEFRMFMLSRTTWDVGGRRCSTVVRKSSCQCEKRTDSGLSPFQGLAECRANSIKTEHVFFTFVGVEERADAIAMSEERIREVESWPRVTKNVTLDGIRYDFLGSLVE